MTPPSTTADWLRTTAITVRESPVVPEHERTAAHDTALRMRLVLWALSPTCSVETCVQVALRLGRRDVQGQYAPLGREDRNWCAVTLAHS